MPQPAVEARVITAMLIEPGMLDACADLELGDLSDYRHRAVLIAIRELQAAGSVVDLDSVFQAIVMRDMSRDSFVAQSVTAEFLQQLVCSGEIRENNEGRCWVATNPPYRDPALLAFDLAQLRRIARSNT